MTEAFNGWILNARMKLIHTILEEIKVQVMERIATLRQFAETKISDISPHAMQNLEANKILAMKCHIRWNGDNGFEVLEGEYGHNVDLKNMTCTCRSWMLKGIPCQHVVCALFHKQLNPEDYIAKWYRKETYLKAYNFFLELVRGIKLWPDSQNPTIQPP